MLTSSAFVPSHVTGFFEICDEAKDIRQRGSRGAGICLSKGVFTIVEVEESDKKNIEIFLNEEKKKAPVSRYVVNALLGEKPYYVKVSSTLELPVGQGFGMSGAGALSTSLALSNALNLGLGRDEIVCIAHSAEIACGTGLGDVMPQSMGGVVLRKKEGCYPHGIIEKININEIEIVLCIIGKPLPTKSIITDSKHKKVINEYGNRYIEKIIKKTNFEDIMQFSYEFCQNTKLMSKEVNEALLIAREYGAASMAMLGNSIFVVGDTDNLVTVLSNLGEVHICRIDGRGMRIVGDEE